MHTYIHTFPVVAVTMEEIAFTGVGVSDQWAAKYEKPENCVKYLHRRGPQVKTCST